mgnify:FL=1
MIALLAFVTAPSWALEIDFSDKTFFTKDRRDRIYFQDNGNFEQQLQNPYGSLPLGSTLKGTWVFDESEQQLCMSYRQFSIGQHCFMVERYEFENLPTEIHALGSDNKTHFIWRHARDGNWLLSPFGMAALRLVDNGDNIRNSILLDNMIVDYLTGKVIENKDYYIYVVNRDLWLMIDKDSQNESQKAYLSKWSVSSLRTEIVHPETAERLTFYVFTMGREFAQNKPRQIYWYKSPDQFTTEGEDFVVTPYEEYDQKEIFSAYLDESGNLLNQDLPVLFE